MGHLTLTLINLFSRKEGNKEIKLFIGVFVSMHVNNLDAVK